MKQSLAFILAFVMLFGMLPLNAFAAEITVETQMTEETESVKEAGNAEIAKVSEATGDTETEESEVSGDTEKKDAPVAHEHDYASVKTPPTCVNRGYTTYTCICSDSYVDDYVDSTGEHNYESGICVGCGKVQSQSIVITRQPVPDVAMIGEKATVFVEAEGEGLTYQWYYRDSPDGVLNKSTVTKNTYTLTVKKTNVNRELYCVITDAQGNQVTTDTVRLLQPLAEELQITTQPVPDVAMIGEKATVFVEAEGEGLTYQWYYRDSPDGVLNKSTVTKNTYTLTVKKTNVNRELYCVITDAHGNQVTTDVVKLLQPVEDELAIITQPVPDYAIIGETASVCVEAQGVGLTYQWYFRNMPEGALSKSSITSNTYATTVSKTNTQREVYCVITDGHGKQVTTDVVKLLQPLEEELKIITQPVPSNAAIGEKATVSMEVQGVGLTYQWYFRNTPGGELSKSSITSNTYTTTVSKTNTQREVYCVITDGHGNQVTTNTVNLIKTEQENPTTYYGSLSDALSGAFGSLDQTGAAVKVTEESGKIRVVLLQNAELAETLTIAKEITLDLNGYTILSTASPVISVETEYATIRDGNVNLTASGSGTSKSPSVAILAKSGTTLEICDSNVTATDSENGTVVGVLGEENSELKITGTTVIVTAETSLQNVGVHAYGPATLTECTVIAESDYTANKAGTNYASHAYGIIGEKDLTLVNCYVWGPHSGVTAKGNVFVDGGTYEGYGHGSFYFAGSNTTSHIYNASVNWAEMREGTYADSVAGTNGAGMYLGGGAKNVSVYMDNCQVYGTLYGIVLRNSGGEQNNSIYISNSAFTGCSKYAYRNGQNASYKTLKVYSGVNNDYSAIKGKLSINPERVISTDESYAPAK